jgi:hypothetical protein
LIFSATRRCIDWHIVGLLAGQELDHSHTNPCPSGGRFCLSRDAGAPYEKPRAIRV